MPAQLQYKKILHKAFSIPYTQKILLREKFCQFQYFISESFPCNSCIKDIANFTTLAKYFSPKVSAIQRWLGLEKFLSSKNSHAYSSSIFYIVYHQPICIHTHTHITHSSDQSIPLIRLLVAPWLGTTLPPILSDGPSAIFPPLFSCINLFDNAWRYGLLIHEML